MANRGSFLNGADLRAMKESMVRTDTVLDPHARRARRNQLPPVTDTLLEGQPDHHEHPLYARRRYADASSIRTLTRTRSGACWMLSHDSISPDRRLRGNTRHQSDPNDRSNDARRQESNVREPRRAEEMLAREILNSSANLVFLKDPKGRYLFVNRQFEKTFHVRQAQIKGKKDDEIFPPEQAAAFRANDVRVLQARVPMEFEETTLQDDGPHTSIVQRFPLIDPDGTVYATGGIGSDITERKRAEQALRESGSTIAYSAKARPMSSSVSKRAGSWYSSTAATDSARQALVRADVGAAFAAKDSLRAILQACAESVVRHFEVAIVRIWTADKDRDVLEIQATAELYTDLDGAQKPGPAGFFKIDLIAKERKRLVIDDDVVNDPRIDKAWVRNEGVIAFAGHPLLVRDAPWVS